MIPRGVRAAAILAASLLVTASALCLRQQQPPFDHTQHAKLFVGCNTCHAGATHRGAPMFPPATACASCHDGTTARRIAWRTPTAPRASNLRFDHLQHAESRRLRGDTTQRCADCHADAGAPWMTVRAPSAPQCISCHSGGSGTHLTQPDSACATCHVPLARATALSRARIARFPAPPSHLAPDFMRATGHGVQAKPISGTTRVAQSCATCHAREFCASCHVNAPETATIQALEPDPRSLLLPHVLKAPASHAGADFERRHGSAALKSVTSCRTCHTQESCLTCHRSEVPAPVKFLYAAGPGRGPGAQTTRHAPSSHIPGWPTHHGAVAAASMRSCTSCHARQECLTCHVPNAATRNSYHPAAYVTRHPADAYSRASSCTNCHNTGQFCQSCHQQSGLTTKRTLLGAAGYHDGNRQFFLGHGQAARQSLESCVSCHVERDCLTCHSVVGGRSFDPHGPGFDPVQMLKKNPQLCIACHGTSIPTRRVAP